MEAYSKHDIVKERYLLNDLFFSFPFEYFGSLIQFQLTGDNVLVASKPLKPVYSESTEGLPLPDIFPIKPTITLNIQNMYKLDNIYRTYTIASVHKIAELTFFFIAINKEARISHPHTVFMHYNKLQVQNIYEEEVTQEQIFGRSLLKTFTVAASYARQRFGVSFCILTTSLLKGKCCRMM